MQKRIYVLLSSVLFLVVILRAIFVPLVHDEIATFYYYIQSFDFNPFTGAHADANNHILNSFLASVSYRLFGYSSFSLRLPNVLAFVVYLFAIWNVAQFYRQSITKWMFIIASLGAIYFIQFFSLTRGYGLSMAFFMLSISYLLKLYCRAGSKEILLFVCSILLALLANLTLLPVSILLFGIAIYFSFQKNKEQNQSTYFRLKTIIIFFISILIITALVFLSFRMKAAGSLYYGNSQGFWTNTVLSLLELLFENKGVFVQSVLFVSLLVYVVLLLFQFKAKGLRFLFDVHALFTVCFLGAITSTFFMHYWLGVNFPEDRVGLYFVSLYIGAFFFILDQFTSRVMYFACVAVIFPIHFILNINLSYTSLWKKEYIPDSFFNEIQTAQSTNQYPVTVSGDALRIFNYNEKLYKKQASGNALQFWTRDMFNTESWTIKTKEHPAKYFDFIIAEEKWMRSISHLYTPLKTAPRSNHILYKRKQATKKKKFSENYIEQHAQTNSEFNELIKLNVDSLSVSAVYVGIDLTMQSLKHPFKGRIVAQVKDITTNQVLAYEYIQMNWIAPKILSQTPIRKSLILSNLPKNDKLEILVYVWNINSENYTLYNSKIELYKIIDKNQ